MEIMTLPLIETFMTIGASTIIGQKIANLFGKTTAAAGNKDAIIASAKEIVAGSTADEKAELKAELVKALDQVL